MDVLLELNGSQRSILKKDKIKIRLRGGRQVKDLISYIQSSMPNIFPRYAGYTVFVNNLPAPFEQELKDNDKISFIPHLGGG